MGNGAEKIKELKAAILAIEWEITDEAMDNLTRTIEPLKEQWVGKKPLLVCLQVIGTLGQYIKKAREKAHPDAINLLHSVFATLETVITDEGMDDGRKIFLVRGAVEKYNNLKTQLAKRRKEPGRESPAGKLGGGAPSVAGQGGSTIRDLMEQKEDQAVDGAFNTIFQEMVSDDRAGAQSVPVPPAMPSVGDKAGPDAKEVVLARVDDEEFPEADSLLDDFFSEDGLAFSIAEAKAEKETHADETVEVDLGQIVVKKEKTAEPERPFERIEEEEITVDKLARIIQNMKYGISATLLKQLSEEIASLRSQHPDHYSVSLFMEVIAAVGRHLGTYGDVAADLSRNMLQTVYDRLAHSLFTMQPQKNLLSSHLETMHDFSKWHEQVVAELAERAAAGAKRELSAEMEETVKSIVRREVNQLRQELLEVIEKTKKAEES
ncbi:MAG: hypothetical protein KKC76_06385 [Proteobacteria bacterium]|nr:hypothetical protein [Pseudomonadota bacterium]MBU4297650.1 hypothetical protein [Pseudomonadota bacterium]MCG2749988.1 hypothetical protein [Desulfobulbaceae bacterium]